MSDIIPEQPVMKTPEAAIPKPAEVKPVEKPLGASEQAIIQKIIQDTNPDDALRDIAEMQAPEDDADDANTPAENQHEVAWISKYDQDEIKALEKRAHEDPGSLGDSEWQQIIGNRDEYDAHKYHSLKIDQNNGVQLNEEYQNFINTYEEEQSKLADGTLTKEARIQKIKQDSNPDDVLRDIAETKPSATAQTTAEMQTPEESKMRFESFPYLESTLNYARELLKNPGLEELRGKDEILAKNWTDELIDDIEPACKRAIADGRSYATVMQFADASLAVPPDRGPLTDFHQFEDDEYAAKYFSVLGAKARDSAERGFLLDAGGPVIKAILQDENFPRVTQEEYRSEKVTHNDFIVTAPDGKVSSIVVRTRVPDVQLVLNGVFPDGSRHYLVSPGLRVKMQKSETAPDLSDNTTP